MVQEVPVAIVNQDATKLSRDYMSMLDASEGLKVMPNYIDLQEAKTAYYSKNVMGIIIIPKNFEKNIKQGKQTDVVTFSDASIMLFYKKVLGYVSVITGYFNAGIAIKKEMLQAKPYNQATQEYFPIKPISTSLFNYSYWTVQEMKTQILNYTSLDYFILEEQYLFYLEKHFCILCFF